MFPGGYDSSANFRQIVGRFIHADSGNASQALQPSANWYLAPSVAASAENQRPCLLNRKRRAVQSRELRTQEMHHGVTRATEITTKLIHETIQYLQVVSDHISSFDKISSREWATMHLATQLLQSRYEDHVAGENIQANAPSDFHAAQTQPELKCEKCAAADEERLYD
ncbi:uncharacterized protein N7511_001784 [Penicillium nucicola]|uniref:uncharacterized protein n=1 Tax=Penicillium nucicola TaxID=1850975 RepID=UPI002545A176|nr:uncharacterized protein N7511_001784 [Penicillium nucicola]KAJ5769733.1 hypothetical protein N7511_001784 [Penicillium nucicola]